MSKYLEFRNISTIVNSIIVIVCGYLLGLLASFGLSLPVNASELAALISALIFGIFSYYNAKHHNTLFDKDTDTIYIPLDNLSDNQVQAINNFVENCIKLNNKNENESELNGEEE